MALAIEGDVGHFSVLASAILQLMEIAHRVTWHSILRIAKMHWTLLSELRIAKMHWILLSELRIAKMDWNLLSELRTAKMMHENAYLCTGIANLVANCELPLLITATGFGAPIVSAAVANLLTRIA